MPDLGGPVSRSNRANHMSKSVIIRNGPCSDKVLKQEADQLRQMLKDCKAYNHAAKMHDDINLVELYMDTKSDLAFIAFWQMPHAKWMKKYY